VAWTSTSPAGKMTMATLLPLQSLSARPADRTHLRRARPQVPRPLEGKAARRTSTGRNVRQFVRASPCRPCLWAQTSEYGVSRSAIQRSRRGVLSRWSTFSLQTHPAFPPLYRYQKIPR
jgi:hypothetical protein